MASSIHRYSRGEKKAAVELYFSSKEMSLRDVVEKLGHPSLRSLNIWASVDPRYEGKTNYTHSKREIVACRLGEEELRG